MAKSEERRERLLAKLSRHAQNLSIIEAMEAAPQAQVQSSSLLLSLGLSALLDGAAPFPVTLCTAAAACRCT